MYVGTTAEINPTPKPPMTRPIYNWVRLVVLIAHSVWIRDPSRKMQSAMIRAFFLPLIDRLVFFQLITTGAAYKVSLT